MISWRPDPTPPPASIAERELSAALARESGVIWTDCPTRHPYLREVVWRAGNAVKPPRMTGSHRYLVGFSVIPHTRRAAGSPCWRRYWYVKRHDPGAVLPVEGVLPLSIAAGRRSVAVLDVGLIAAARAARDGSALWEPWWKRVEAARALPYTPRGQRNTAAYLGAHGWAFVRSRQSREGSWVSPCGRWVAATEHGTADAIELCQLRDTVAVLRAARWRVDAHVTFGATAGPVVHADEQTWVIGVGWMVDAEGGRRLLDWRKALRIQSERDVGAPPAPVVQ